MMVLVCVWLVWCEIGLLDGCGVINMNGWLVDVDWFIWNGLNVVNVLVGFISLKYIDNDKWPQQEVFVLESLDLLELIVA